MSEALASLGEKIVAATAGAVAAHEVSHGHLVLHTEASRLVELVRFLRDDASCRFVNIIDVTAVDYPGREKRFDVVYHFMSPMLNARLRIKLEASETAAMICDQAARVLASYGYAMEYPVQRYLRDVRFTLIGGGTSEILKAIIAKELSA